MLQSSRVGQGVSGHYYPAGYVETVKVDGYAYIEQHIPQNESGAQGEESGVRYVYAGESRIKLTD